MIFPAEHIHLIRGGQVTLTRRLQDPARDRCSYLPGRTYSVQRSRKQPGEDFRILVTDVQEMVLGAGTDDDARREGFKHATGFQRAWRRMHGSWDPALIVWVISFAVARDEVRLLRVKSGYTDKRHLALPDEPEAVDQASQSEIVAGVLHVHTTDAGHLEVVRGGPLDQIVTKPQPAKPRRGLHELAEETLRARLPRHEGLSPDEVHAVDQVQGTPGEIRERRRAMGLRGIDGLPKPSVLELEDTLARVVASGPSVRQLAYVMDWSHGKAQRHLADLRELAA